MDDMRDGLQRVRDQLAEALKQVESDDHEPAYRLGMAMADIRSALATADVWLEIGR